MSQQYLRKVSLVVSEGPVTLDLSEMRIVFTVRQFDLQTPTNAVIRIYNLSKSTAKNIEQEFTGVTLQAGYQNGPYGLIFKGTIIQVRRGRESPVDTYTDIVAANWDEANNFSVVNKTLQGATPQMQLDTLFGVMGIKPGYISPLPSKTLPRGKVLFGMARDRLRDVNNDTGTRYSYTNDGIQVIAATDVLQGNAVVLNAQTGMIGLPEQTEDGIEVTSLINPNYRIGGQVQINNSSIQKATIDPSVQGLNNATILAQMLDADGNYKILVVNHQGDTRGTPWYSHLICVGLYGVSPNLVAKAQD